MEEYTQAGNVTVYTPGAPPCVQRAYTVEEFAAIVWPEGEPVAAYPVEVTAGLLG